MKAGLAGWQWMFLMEGIPAVLFGSCDAVFICGQSGAGGLAFRGGTRLAVGDAGGNRRWFRQVGGRSALLKMGRIWMLALVYFGLNTVSYGKSVVAEDDQELSGASNFTVGALSAIPYVQRRWLWWRWSALGRSGERDAYGFACFRGGQAR